MSNTKPKVVTKKPKVVKPRVKKPKADKPKKPIYRGNPVGTKISGSPVVAVNVREWRREYMDVNKICEHKLDSGRSMFRLAGTSTDGKGTKMSLIIKKTAVPAAEKAVGKKIAVCATTKVPKKKVKSVKKIVKKEKKVVKKEKKVVKPVKKEKKAVKKVKKVKKE